MLKENKRPNQRSKEWSKCWMKKRIYSGNSHQELAVSNGQEKNPIWQSRPIKRDCLLKRGLSFLEKI